MITAPASDSSAATAISPPRQRGQHRRPVPALAAGADDRATTRHARADDGEHEPADREAGRHQRHLELVPDEDRAGEEPEAAGERDQRASRAAGVIRTGPMCGPARPLTAPVRTRVRARVLRALVAAHRAERSRAAGAGSGARRSASVGAGSRRRLATSAGSRRPPAVVDRHVPATAAAASARRRRPRRARRTPPPGTRGPPRSTRTSRSSGATRILNPPPRRNGPSRRLHARYSGASGVDAARTRRRGRSRGRRAGGRRAGGRGRPRPGRPGRRHRNPVHSADDGVERWRRAASSRSGSRRRQVARARCPAGDEPVAAGVRRARRAARRRGRRAARARRGARTILPSMSAAAGDAAASGSGSGERQVSHVRRGYAERHVRGA